MDGATDWFQPVVASTTPTGRGLRFHVPGSPVLRFGVYSGGKPVTGGPDCPFDLVRDEMILGGVIRSHIRHNGAAIRLSFAFLNNNTVGIEARLEDGAAAAVFVQCLAECERHIADKETMVFNAESASYALAGGDTMSAADGIAAAGLSAERPTARFAWACGQTGSGAAGLAMTGVAEDLEARVRAYIEFIDSLPPPNTDNREVQKAYVKAASVMRVNCCSAQGAIRFPWTTPDRWPHANMWIWDSAFHAVGLRHISPEWAENAIRAVLSVQRSDGFIPITATPDPSRSYELIQPPILAWAALKVFEISQNLEFLRFVFERAGMFVEYILRNLDSDQNGLAEWTHSNASGMDNSPRFDQPVKDAIDLNCYLAGEMQSLAAIASILKNERGAARWIAEADGIARRIEASLWDEHTGFYYDNDPQGRLVNIKTIAGLLPLFAGVCSRERASRLVRHLTNPAEFWREFPVSSVSADEEAFCDNMWRGPVWVNCNYLLIEGLKRYGFDREAAELREKTIAEVTKWCSADGIIYEFYDSEGSTNPAHLHRKQRGGPGALRGVVPLETSVCDYNWTASLFFDLIRAAA